jgi:hypothetical protein
MLSSKPELVLSFYDSVLLAETAPYRFVGVHVFPNILLVLILCSANSNSKESYCIVRSMLVGTLAKGKHLWREWRHFKNTPNMSRIAVVKTVLKHDFKLFLNKK